MRRRRVRVCLDGLASSRHAPGVALLTSAFRRVLGLGMRVAFVRVPEPSRPLLLVTDQSNPVVAAGAKTLPDVGVAVHATRVKGFLEGSAGRGGDSMREGLVVPVGRVLEDEPATGFADAAPAFTFVAMPADPARCVQVTLEPEVLLPGNQIGIRWIHVLLWRRGLLLRQGAKQVRRVGELGVTAVQGVRVRVGLEHAEEAMRQQRCGRWLERVTVVVVEVLGWQLRGEQHAVSLKARSWLTRHKIWRLYSSWVCQSSCCPILGS